MDTEILVVLCTYICHVKCNIYHSIVWFYWAKTIKNVASKVKTMC